VCGKTTTPLSAEAGSGVSLFKQFAILYLNSNFLFAGCNLERAHVVKHYEQNNYDIKKIK